MQRLYTSLLVLTAGLGWAQDPVHRRFTTADGLPSNTVYPALQDRNGFVWFATDNGASRFDGVEFKNFTLRDGLGDLEVINLAEDSKGRIWFLPLNGHLSYYLNGKVYNAQHHPDLALLVASSGWQSFAEGPDGSLWFGGVRNDVARLDLDGENDHLWSWEGGEMSVLIGEDGTVMLDKSGTLLKYENDGWVELLKNERGNRNPMVFPAKVPGKGPLTFGPERMLELVGGTWREVVPAIPTDSKSQHGCWRDRTGAIWVRHSPSGLEAWQGTTKRLFFPTIAMNYAFVDAAGGRWFSTAREGVLYVEPANWQQDAIALAYPVVGGVRSLLISQQGDLWIGTNSGTIKKLNEDGSGRDHGDPYFGRVVDLVETESGSLYAATDRCVLHLTDQGAVPVLSTHPHLRNGTAAPEPIGSKDLTLDGRGGLWSAYFGLYHSSDPPRTTFVQQSNELSQERISALHRSSDGTLYAGVRDRLLRVLPHAREMIASGSELFGLRVTTFAEAPDGALLIGTMGRGVQLFDGHQVHRQWSTANGLPSDHVRRIRVHGDTLLVATDEGLAMGVYHPGEAVTWTIMDRSSGLQDERVNDAALYRGEVIIATGTGLVRGRIASGRPTWPVPFVYIAGAAMDGEELAERDQLTVPSGDVPVRVEFHAVAFAERQALQYEYRFWPNTTWSSSSVNTLEFKGLSPGEHVLHVRARMAGGDWSEPAALTLNIDVLWWKRPWFRVLLIVLAIALTLFLSRLRWRRHYRDQLAELRARIAVNNERSRIAADIHDDLGADLSRLFQLAQRSEHDPILRERAPLSEGLSNSIDKLDEIIWALDPRRDSLQSTVQFIEQQAREAAENASLAFRTDVQVPQHAVALGAAARRELMLIAQEAVRNVVEHARATTLRVDWNMTMDAVDLSISDDGIGFEKGTGTSLRNGLSNMQERAERIGADLSFAAKKGEGTTVKVRLPMPGIIRTDDAEEEDRSDISA